MATVTTTAHGQDPRAGEGGGAVSQEREVADVNAATALATPPAPPAPTVFKAIGYVEKAGGQLEAIILQENQVQVVHIGDRIAGRYRVTKITPDLVDALDETLVQSSMLKSGGPESGKVAARGTELLRSRCGQMRRLSRKPWRLPRKGLNPQILKGLSRTQAL